MFKTQVGTNQEQVWSPVNCWDSLTTEEGGCDGRTNSDQVHHQTELVGVLTVGGEGVEHCRHDHTDLVAANNDQNNREVLPGDSARDWRADEVPEKNGEEEDEPEEMGPDVESLIMKTDDWPQALCPGLARSVSGPNVRIWLEILGALVVLEERLAMIGKYLGDESPHSPGSTSILKIIN